VDSVPDFPAEEKDLVSKGWEKVILDVEPRKVYNVGRDGTTAYRQQYGLKHRISVTVHSIMGSTVRYLVSQVLDRKGDGLWEASMVVVLLSRTRRAQDMYFVGPKMQTINSLWMTLVGGGRYSEATDTILESLLSRTAINISQIMEVRGSFRFVPVEIMLPSKGEFVAYLIVSLKDPRTSYTGHTQDVRKRLNQHNSLRGGSHGTGGVHVNAAPWVLAAVVVGFNCRDTARQFEGRWRGAIDLYVRDCRGEVEPMEKIYRAEKFLQDGLRLLVCGNIRRNNANSTVPITT
jgi:hypothetical protein